MQLTEARQKGLILELTVTSFEILNLLFLYFISKYYIVVIAIVIYDLYSNLLYLISSDFLVNSITALRKSDVHLTRNIILRFIRSLTYVLSFIILIELGIKSTNYILYSGLVLLLITSKLHRERLLMILHYESGYEEK